MSQLGSLTNRAAKHDTDKDNTRHADIHGLGREADEQSQPQVTGWTMESKSLKRTVGTGGR